MQLECKAAEQAALTGFLLSAEVDLDILNSRLS